MGVDLPCLSFFLFFSLMVLSPVANRFTHKHVFTHWTPPCFPGLLPGVHVVRAGAKCSIGPSERDLIIGWILAQLTLLANSNRKRGYWPFLTYPSPVAAASNSNLLLSEAFENKKSVSQKVIKRYLMKLKLHLSDLNTTTLRDMNTFCESN